MLTEEHERLLEGGNLAHLATIMPDGSPHVSPLWVDTEDGLILLNTAEGRVKVRNVRRDPRVAISVFDQEDDQRTLIVRGTVVEVTTEGALEHMDKMSRRYDGVPWEPVPDQVRVLIKIRPDHVAM